MNSKQQSFIETSIIESNKQFLRLNEKTQVLMPRNGMSEVTKTRFSHSYEVANSAMLMCEKIAADLNVRGSDIDYQNVLYNVCLLHDIGHPPFGHEGAYFISNYFKNIADIESFSDNNNNLVVIEKNEINVSDYTIASTIKYPHNLYKSQKEKYIPMLEKALEEDYLWYNNIGLKDGLKKQTKTIACQIMDEADRNSYVCSDLSDFFSLGNKLTKDEIVSVNGYDKLTDIYKEKIDELLNIIIKNKKTEIKSFFNLLKIKFNTNYKLTANGIIAINEDLLYFREFLNKIEYIYFIKPLKYTERDKNISQLESFINYVMNNKYYPSEYYSQKINNEKDDKKRLIYIRDMIGEVSDWYVLNFNISNH